ncbi:MAG TPA: hypothetical protein PLM85_07595 [Nitrosomonas sp.]|nr:hypothetical protein [Nitrosomonas sp.]HNG35974.1 hypothetical protein [Nitrosomonas sp.]
MNDALRTFVGIYPLMRIWYRQSGKKDEGCWSKIHPSGARTNVARG